MGDVGSPLYLPTPSVPPATGIPLVNAPPGMGVPVAGLSPVDYWAQLGGLVFNCVDAAGIQWFFSDPEGWADGTTIATAQQQRGVTHGGYMGTSYLEARNIVFAGNVKAPTPVLAWQARNVLLGVVASLSALGVMNVDTSLVINEPDAQKNAGVRPADKPTITPVEMIGGSVGLFTFSIPLVARDPRKYSARSTYHMTLPVVSSGMTFPVLAPFSVTFGATGTSVDQLVTNAGNFPTAPLLTFTGPLSNPRLANLTTGQTIGFDVVLGAGETLVVDCDISSVMLDGYADRANTVQPGGQFISLPPGDNLLQFAASTYTADASLDVVAASAWW